MKLHTLTLIGVVLFIFIESNQVAVFTNMTEPGRIPEVLGQIETGTLHGTVTDSSGAVIPGVRVILELPRGGQRVTTTSDDGSYRFDKVEFGSGYRLRFSYSGFGVVEKTNIQVQPGQAMSVDAELAIGPPPSPFPTPRPTVHPTPRPSPPPPSPSPPPTPQPSVAPSPWPSPFATPSPTPSSGGQDWDVIVGREIQKLRESKILFNPPLDMQQGKGERVEVRISAEEIGAALNQGLRGRGDPQVEPIKVSPIMKVVLMGDGKAFNIEPRSDEEQIVAGKPYAEWSWDVTPLESGAHTLSLKVVAVVHIAERGEKASDIPVGDKSIHVRISPWYATKRFVGNNWQWLWTVILLPGGGLLWSLRRKKNRRAGFK